MAKSSYYVYAAEDDHRLLGRLSVDDRSASNLGRVIAQAQKKFKLKNLRIECTRRDYRPPVGRVKVQPQVARKGW